LLTLVMYNINGVRLLSPDCRELQKLVNKDRSPWKVLH